ncbi:MAG TPA: MFS transporter, partial [Taishania sp.]|nr:MFS transporter [Taishania sp.]
MFKGFSKNFWLLASGVLFFMTSFNLLIPELNAMMERLGAGDKKGLVFISFSIAAAISRPISGKLSDTIGRKKVMYFGILIGILCCIAYPLADSIMLFLLLRLAHGFCAGFHPTGATAMVTDILPTNRRGQGMGIWGVFVSVGFGFGQMLSSSIVNHLGFEYLFPIASGFAILSGILLIKVRETLPENQLISFSPNILKLKWNDVVDPAVRPSAIVMFLSAACSGYVFVMTPDISGYLGLDNKGIFFGFYTMSTLVVRLFTFSLSDILGRRKTLILAMGLLAIAMLLVGIAQTPTVYLGAALLYGVASGISSPTLMAWMADLSTPTRRGVGSGTLYIALECGFMFGAAMSILTYDNTFKSVYTSFGVASLFALVAIAYLIWHLKF